MTADEDEDFAVVAFREEGRWEVARLPDRLVGDLDGLVAAVRQQPGEGGTIGLVDIADEFFVAVRVCGDDVRILLSDVTAAVAWDLARSGVDILDTDEPDAIKAATHPGAPRPEGQPSAFA